MTAGHPRDPRVAGIERDQRGVGAAAAGAAAAAASRSRAGGKGSSRTWPERPRVETKEGRRCRRPPRQSLPVGCGYSAASAGGSTEMKVRPLKPLWKVTLPVSVAKMVWSRPRPTPVPGQHLVPRWRTRMLPGLHRLAAELLHAEPPALAVAAVAGRAACLLVCHRACSFRSRPRARRRLGGGGHLGLRLGGLLAAGERCR